MGREGTGEFAGFRLSDLMSETELADICSNKSGRRRGFRLPQPRKVKPQ